MLKERVSLWLAQPGLRPRIRHTWPKIRDKLRRGAVGRETIVRWTGVRGPIAALQAAFLQAGWGPKCADVWSRPLSDGTIDDGIFPTPGDD
eukprot:6466438-Pyramimonas_sp.AAC.1